MLINFLIKKISVLLITLFLCAVIPMNSFGQSCPACGPSRVYTGTALELNTNTNGAGASLADANWSGAGNFSSPSIARFDQNRNYVWKGNDFNLRGIVLEGGANLTLDRPNDGNNDSFVIGGPDEANKGCIVIKSGSTLTLRYISSLENVTICIESGGELILDSRESDRNDYLFNNVDITLNGPDAKLTFGDADINLGDGNLTIVGYSGTPNEGCTEDASGNLFLPNPIPNISADPNKTNLKDFCNFLARAGFSITPVEYLSFTAKYNSSDRSNEIKWVTASEKNNSHFIIQRAVNDIKSWEDLGEVSGAINSDMPIEYDFIDDQLPLVGGNVYYRLKQVDLEGKSSLGEVVSVRVGAISGKGTWRVFPNPNNGEAIRLELLHKEKYKGEEVSIRLLFNYNNLDNKQIVTKDIFDLSNQLQQLLHPIGKGVAVLEIIWGNQVEHIKILKK